VAYSAAEHYRVAQPAGGTTWEPRRVTARTKPCRICRKMFAKLKTANYLKFQVNKN